MNLSKRVLLACLLLLSLFGCRGSLGAGIPDVDYRTKGDQAACGYGPWSKHCPSAFWVRDVLAVAGRSVEADTGSALETEGVFVWATETDGPPHGDAVSEIDGLVVYGDGPRLAWRVHALTVWTAPGSANFEELSPTDIEDLVLASKNVPYP